MRQNLMMLISAGCACGFLAFAQSNSLPGSAFDRDMRAMVRDHKMDIAEFQKESNGGQDTDIKSFASSTLPTLQDHLSQAQQVESNVSASACAK